MNTSTTYRPLAADAMLPARRRVAQAQEELRQILDALPDRGLGRVAILGILGALGSADARIQDFAAEHCHGPAGSAEEAEADDEQPCGFLVVRGGLPRAAAPTREGAIELARETFDAHDFDPADGSGWAVHPIAPSGLDALQARVPPRFLSITDGARPWWRT